MESRTCQCGCGAAVKGTWARGHHQFARSFEERFWAKVKRHEGAHEDRCWLWIGATDGGRRYGSISRDGRVQRAHRVAYELLVGPIPEGLELDHLCGVTLCVNVAHLEPVDHRTNVLRGRSLQAENARKTHCPAGHVYDDENTYRQRNGGRLCKACLRASGAERQRQYRARKKAQRVAS